MKRQADSPAVGNSPSPAVASPSNAFDLLSRVLRMIAGRAAQGCAYEANWPANFAREQVKEVWAGSDDAWGRGPLTTDELRGLSKDERETLGFGRWDDEGNLFLIPLWAWGAIADGQELTSISGNRKTKGRDEIDLDVRFGCIAWGYLASGAAVSEAALPDSRGA